MSPRAIPPPARLIGHRHTLRVFATSALSERNDTMGANIARSVLSISRGPRTDKTQKEYRGSCYAERHATGFGNSAEWAAGVHGVRVTGDIWSVERLIRASVGMTTAHLAQSYRLAGALSKTVASSPAVQTRGRIVPCGMEKYPAALVSYVDELVKVWMVHTPVGSSSHTRTPVVVSWYAQVHGTRVRWGGGTKRQAAA